jgi:hypothetical protein
MSCYPTAAGVYTKAEVDSATELRNTLSGAVTGQIDRAPAGRIAAPGNEQNVATEAAEADGPGQERARFQRALLSGLGPNVLCPDEDAEITPGLVGRRSIE